MKQSVKTALMTKLFSGDESTKEEIFDAFKLALTKGTASTKNYSFAKLGDNVLVEDKANGEVTKMENGAENIECEAVKTVSRNFSEATDTTNVETSKETEAEPQKVQEDVKALETKIEDMVTSAVESATKAMSAKVESLEKTFSDFSATLGTITKRFSDMDEASKEKVDETLVVTPEGEKVEETPEAEAAEEVAEENKTFSTGKAVKEGENDFGKFFSRVSGN